jgi:hypothetical protein
MALRDAIELLNQLAAHPDLQPAEISQFEKAVSDREIKLEDDRDCLLHETLRDLAYDLAYPLTKEETQAEIQATISNIRDILSATQDQITARVQEMQRPALEAARKRKRRFFAGPDGIKDEG